MDLARWIEGAATGFEIVGVATMVIATLYSGISVALSLRQLGRRAFHVLRQRVGRGILLGLELLVAADIIRTVSHVPTLRAVVVLGLIVLIRTFLSFTLEAELEGRWPWQQRKQSS